MNEQQPLNDPGPKPEQPTTNKGQRFWAFIAILTVLVGQIFVYTTPVDVGRLYPSPIWITLAGITLFVLSQFYHSSRWEEALFARFEISRSMLWVAGSLVLSLLAVLTMLLFEQQLRTNYIPVLTFWMFAGVCYLAAFADGFPSFSLSRVREWVYEHRYELAGIGFITALGAFLRFYNLGEVPRVVNGDEGRVGITAFLTTSYPYVNPFSLWENFGAMYLQTINMFLRVFGVSPFSLRLAAAIGGTLAIPALFLLARQIAGWRVAMIAACLLAVSHTHTHFSRTVAVAYIQGTWLIPLELYFLLSGLVKRSSWRSALGGIILAVHFNIYLDAQIITALVLAYMVIAFVILRPWFKPALDQAWAFWGGFAIMLLPELVYIQQHPDFFFNRVSENGMFQTGWLAQRMADTGQSAFQVLGERVIHAFLSLTYYPSIDFYGSTIPMLSLISATLFMLGLVIVLWKVRSPGFLLLNGYFWAGTISVGVFAIPPSADTYRMLIVLPAAFLIAALGLDYSLQAIGAGWTQNRRVYTTTIGLVLASLLVFNTWAYYFNFAGLCRYSDDDNGQTRFASYLGNYVRTVGKENPAYLLSDDTFFYGSHQSVDFLSNNHPVINVPEPVDTLQAKPNETIIAVPSRIGELRAWADSHPGGELHYEYDCQDTVLLAYRFPP